MPASMMSAPTGGSPKVIGSSIATVAIVPMPGSTPTSVPTSAPIRQRPRLMGENATLKPRARFAKISMTPSAQNAWEKVERKPERVREQKRTSNRQANADDDGFLPPRLIASQRRDHEAHERRDDQTERADRNCENEDRQRHEEGTANAVVL